MNQKNIQLNGHAVTLTADNRAKFRFQASGGQISKLFDLDHSYLHSIRLLHAMLDTETRALYPHPEDLCAHVSDGDTETFTAMFGLANANGWFPTAEEIMANIEKANAELAAQA